MSNLMRGEIAVGTGAEALRLKLDVNALCRLEEEGEAIEDLARKAEGGSVLALRRLVWVMMLHHRPDATLEDAGDAMTLHGAAEVGKALGKLMHAQARPGPDGGEAPAGNAPTPGRKPRRKAAPAAAG